MSGTVGSLLRTQQSWCQQLGTPHTLEWGIAYTSEDYPDAASGNLVREVSVPSAEDIPAAYEEITRFFEERDRVCHRWAPALDQDVEALGRFLTGVGLRDVAMASFAVREWVESPTPEDVRILPARAMRKALRQILTEAGADAASSDGGALDGSVDAAIARLDDPQVEGWVAMRGDAPAGYLAFHQVGDIGRLQSLYVSAEHRRAGVGLALVSQALAMGRRLAMRVVCAGIPTTNLGATALAEKAGMAADGVWHEFVVSASGA